MLNPALNAYRPDLADKRLEGVVKADRFVEPGAHAGAGSHRSDEKGPQCRLRS